MEIPPPPPDVYVSNELVLFRDTDGVWKLQDRRFAADFDNRHAAPAETALTLTFHGKEDAVACHTALTRIVNMVDVVVSVNGWDTVAVARNTSLRRKMILLRRLLGDFGATYGFGAISQRLRHVWVTLDRVCPGRAETFDFDDNTKENIIHSRSVGPVRIQPTEDSAVALHLFYGDAWDEDVNAQGVDNEDPPDTFANVPPAAAGTTNVHEPVSADAPALGTLALKHTHDGLFLVEDRHYDDTGHYALTLSFATAGNARFCLKLMKSVADAADKINFHKFPCEDAEKSERLNQFIGHFRILGDAFGYGATTPFLRGCCHQSQDYLGVQLTKFNDEVTSLVVSRTVRDIREPELPGAVAQDMYCDGGQIYNGTILFQKRGESFWWVEDHCYKVPGSDTDPTHVLGLAFLSEASARDFLDASNKILELLNSVNSNPYWKAEEGVPPSQALLKSLPVLVDSIHAFSKTYGLGAVTPYVHDLWSLYGGMISNKMVPTRLNDNVTDIIHLRTVGPTHATH